MNSPRSCRSISTASVRACRICGPTRSLPDLGLDSKAVLSLLSSEDPIVRDCISRGLALRRRTRRCRQELHLLLCHDLLSAKYFFSQSSLVRRDAGDLCSVVPGTDVSGGCSSYGLGCRSDGEQKRSKVVIAEIVAPRHTAYTKSSGMTGTLLCIGAADHFNP